MRNKEVVELRGLVGVSQSELARKVGVSDGRVVRAWERGERFPSRESAEALLAASKAQPFRDKRKEHKFRFVDLFAGIGGIRLPFQKLGGQCVFTSEWDKFAQKTYAANFGEIPSGDITAIAAADVPDHDVLLAGFPCQAFSQAGLRQGFSDTRGTMFFEIQRILAEKRPAAFLLENVRQLQGHDKGRTLKTILDVLEGRSSADIPDDVPMSIAARKSLSRKLDYEVVPLVLNARDFGVPQNRIRIYLVGFDRKRFPDFDRDAFTTSIKREPKKFLGEVLEENSTVDEKYTLSQKLFSGHERRKQEHLLKGNGFGFSLFSKKSEYCNTISARYYKDGSEILIDQSDIGRLPRKLTPRECARIQGFPEEFELVCSDNQTYKQFGNSVSVPVIQAIAKQMIRILLKQ